MNKSKIGKLFNCTGHQAPKWEIDNYQELFDNSFLVYRGVSFNNNDEFVQFGKTIGDTLGYAFGEILEIKDAGTESKTQFSNRPMCIHQDSVLPEVFADIVMLYCVAAPVEGGEALICDNRKFLALLKQEDSDLYQFFCNAKVEYLNHTANYYTDDVTDKSIIKPTMKKHKVLDISMPYFAFNDYMDPDRNYTAKFVGLSQEESDHKMRQLSSYIRHENVMYEHKLAVGDLIILDNSLVSHGRNGFGKGEERVLNRVQLCHRDKIVSQLHQSEAFLAE